MTDAGTLKERRASSSSGAASVASVLSTMDRRTSVASDEAAPLPPASTEAADTRPETRSRKRNSSADAHELGGARPANLALDTPQAVSAIAEGGRDFICLCTPAPKVPRPRNAFILYRQHHQGQVVAQNPGLANPEISKIIGEQWRIQAEETKDYWKNLAEEEKLRHQRQYPDYRYQPRRNAKSANRPGSAAGEDPGRCPKCGGRYIATPKTPSTPLMTPTIGRGNMQPYMARDGRMFEGEVRHGLPQGKPPFPYPHSGLRDIDEEYDAMSPSSDAKRRRVYPTGHYQPMPPQPPYPSHAIPRQTRQASTGTPPCPSPVYGPGPLPGPSSLGRGGHGGMAPPPRPPQGPYNGQGRNSGFDESLRLPPLQAQIPPPTPTSHEQQPNSGHPLGLGIVHPRDPSGRNLEAIIMSIPFINKLKVLDKISPPFAPPNPMSPDIETRGAVIAVESPDPILLEQVGTALHRGLLSLSEIEVKTWVDGHPRTPREEDSRMSGSSSASSSRKNSHDSLALSDMYVDYMQKMVSWHDKSRQIIRHITSRPMSPGGRSSMGGRRASEGEVIVVQGPVIPPATPRLPVALLPNGFSLTISDRHACRIPIADTYAPVDHWQWMATMWRGIVGPDLVVYVKPCLEEELARGSAVELKGNGLMMVKVLQGAVFDEKMDRRVCFEVVEWLRGGSFKEGFGSM
ncbi:HMG box protein [Plectosphaerella plurivora]|uniref:HMG box protein n=1 Tax=Plectosphaerella plurivora TaxID=936078 RepID=A0A9P9A406_9PEZI|nr:HMG box protein [Plectosphaerella plurivora]